MNPSVLYDRAFSSLGETIDERRARGIYMAMGYSSDLDLICSVDGEHLSKLIEEYLTPQEQNEITRPGIVTDAKTLIRAIVYHCVTGLGGEIGITDPKIACDLFEHSKGMGGTGVQAAMALARLGCPSIVHLTDDSADVTRLLDNECIHTVSDEGELIRAGEKREINGREIHFIIQFRKGDIIRLAGHELSLPASNRLIVVETHINSRLPFQKSYFDWVETNAKSVSSLLVSSFNCIQSEEILNERLETIVNHICRYRENNPNGVVYAEDGFYHSKSIQKSVYERLYGLVDIAGINEEELTQALEVFCGYELDIDDFASCLEGLERMCEYLQVRKGMVLHTKDYSLYYGAESDFEIEKGLVYGNLMATAKAMHGYYGGKNELAGVMSLEFSRKGLDFLAYLDNVMPRRSALLVPTRYLNAPKYTIGLGDSFLAGMQMCFM